VAYVVEILVIKKNIRYQSAIKNNNKIINYDFYFLGIDYG
jgi:hypothetical protein